METRTKNYHHVSQRRKEGRQLASEDLSVVEVVCFTGVYMLRGVKHIHRL